MLFELRATFLEFIISTQTITPAEFNDEETTTFRESTCLQNGVFLSKYLPCFSNKRYGEEEDKILVIMAKLNVRNIRPITKYSYFNCRENDDVAFKFNFAAQLAFLPDVTSLFVG